MAILFAEAKKSFVLLTENNELTSPLSVLFYEEYSNKDHLQNLINKYSDKLQCIVSHVELANPIIPFGKAQYPKIDDYADDVDTMSFLCNLDT